MSLSLNAVATILSQEIDNGDDDWLVTLALISDWTILTVIMLVEVFVLYKLRLKMDFSGKLTLFLHFIVALLRLFQDHYAFKGTLSNVTGTFCQMLIWFSLYYFTFEMNLIKAALTAESPLQFKVTKQRLFWLKNSILSVLWCYGLSMSTIVGIQYGNKDYYDNHLK